MNWFNFYTPDIRSDLFCEATEEQIGAWFLIIAYCCEQENGGMIQGADKWPAIKWQNACRVSPEIIAAPSPLWHFNGIGALCVAKYPTAKEIEVKAKRMAGKKTADIRWGKRRGKNSSATRSVNSSATRRANTEGEDKGEGKRTSPLRALPPPVTEPGDLGTSVSF